MMLSNMNRLTLTPPAGRGVKVMVDYFRSLGSGGVPEAYRLRFLMGAPLTARLHRRVGGDVGLEIGRVSDGSLDVALNILNYYVPPEADGREMIRAKTNFISATARDLHREFCEEYLALMEPEGGEISDEEIMGFIETSSKKLEGPELIFDRRAQREGASDPPVILDLAEDEDEDEDDEQPDDSEDEF